MIDGLTRFMCMCVCVICSQLLFVGSEQICQQNNYS